MFLDTFGDRFAGEGDHLDRMVSCFGKPGTPVHCDPHPTWSLCANFMVGVRRVRHAAPEGGMPVDHRLNPVET